MINMRGDRILELRNGASPVKVGPEITAAREKRACEKISVNT